MVERRKPLLLSSTKILINSLFNSSSTSQPPLDVDGDKLLTPQVSPTLHLPAGILRFSKDKFDSKLSFLDDAALLGLSVSVLKRLSLTSGSLVSFLFFCVFVFVCLMKCEMKLPINYKHY